MFACSRPAAGCHSLRCPAVLTLTQAQGTVNKSLVHVCLLTSCSRLPQLEMSCICHNHAAVRMIIVVIQNDCLGPMWNKSIINVHFYPVAVPATPLVSPSAESDSARSASSGASEGEGCSISSSSKVPCLV